MSQLCGKGQEATYPSEQIIFRDPREKDCLRDALGEKKMLFATTKIYVSENARFAS
jgi:hypothetical protein